MAHLYEVHTSDGRSHDVTTPHHHDDHDHKTFSQHLLDIIKGATSSVVGGVIVNRIIYKGRR